MIVPILTTVAAAAAPYAVQPPAPTRQNIDVLEAIIVAVTAPIGQDGGLRAPLDRRLRLPHCAAPIVDLAPRPVVRCDRPLWRMPLTLNQGAAHATASPADGSMPVRRGDILTLRVDGAGFTLSSSVIAEQDARIGDVIRARRLTGNNAGGGTAQRGIALQVRIKPDRMASPVFP